MNNLTLTIVLFIIIHLASAQVVNFNIKVFLEGPFNGIDMKTDLYNAGLIPLTQPFNAAPWNYVGTESVASIPNGDVVDWVLVELRETTGIALTAIPASVIARQAAFLLKNGQIVSPYDGLPLYLIHEIDNNLYTVVYHRNHLGIMSAYPLIEFGGTYSWDFTTQPAYGVDAQKDLGGEIFGMYSGDTNYSGDINFGDSVFWEYFAGTSGYNHGDLNLDGEADNVDKDDKCLPNFGKSCQVPE